MFCLSAVRYLPEEPCHAAAIAAIADEAFGPGRFARAAERVRERAPHDPALCFVACLGGSVVGSVRQTPIRVGRSPVLMLGPLAVRPAFKGRGIGRALMGLAAETAAASGEAAILLVGDPPYYEPFGYRPLPPGRVAMPGPVDPARLLGLALAAGGLDGLAGAVAPRS